MNEPYRKHVIKLSRFAFAGVIFANFTFPIHQFILGQVPQFDIAMIQMIWQCIVIDLIVTIKLWNK